MRILIIDDHPLIRYGLQASLQAHLPAASFDEAESPEAALAILNRPPRPDLILLDLRLPTLADGLELLVNLRKVATRSPVLVLAGELTHDTVAAVRDNGASGFISKGEPPGRLAQAIQTCLQRPDEFLLRAALPPAPTRVAAPPAPSLIPRLWQVFAQVAEGKPNKVIARELGVTEGAVKNYMTKLLDATGASNRGEAIKLYIENIERWRADPRYREAMRARD